MGDRLAEQLGAVGAMDGDILLGVGRRGAGPAGLLAAGVIQRGDLLTTLDERPVRDAPDRGLLLQLDAEHAAGGGEVPLLTRTLEAGAGAGADAGRPAEPRVLQQMEQGLTETDD